MPKSIPRPGDFVKVEYTGYVSESEILGDVGVGNATASGGKQWVSAKHCTVLRRAYVPRVGDIVRHLSPAVTTFGLVESIDGKTLHVRCGTAPLRWAVADIVLYARPEEDAL